MSTAVFQESPAVQRRVVATESPRLRLTTRGRVVITFLIAVPLAVAAFALVLNGGGATATDTGSSATFRYVTVSPGESLWQVASKIAPQANPSDVIADIVTLNQLDTASVYPGEELAIPLQYSGK